MLRPPLFGLGRWMPASTPLAGKGATVADNSRQETETYNPWSVVNLVFHHLADQGLHPTLGAPGDPGPPAAALLRALGIEPAAEGNRQVMAAVRSHLDEIRTAVLGEPGDG